MPRHWWVEKGEEMAHEGYEILFPKKPGRERQRRGLKRWQKILSVFAIVFIGVFVWLWIAVARGLPTLDQLENPHPEVATQLISADGERLDQYFIKNRTTVTLQNVPRDVIAALISTEDRDFYKHWGINLWGNIRAAWTDLVTLSPRQGASTITQQLARNLYLSQEKSVMRSCAKWSRRCRSNARTRRTRYW